MKRAWRNKVKRHDYSPVPLTPGANPLQIIHDIAHDLITHAQSDEDRRAGRRLLGALQEIINTVSAEEQ